MKLEILNMIEKAREEKGIKQAQLAETLDVSVDTISNWFCGRTEIPPNKAFRLSDILMLPELRLAYCTECPMNCIAAKKMKLVNADKKLYALHRTLGRAASMFGELGDITEDGKVSPQEVKPFKQRMKEFIRREQSYTECRVALEKEYGDIFREIYAELEEEGL